VYGVHRAGGCSKTILTLRPEESVPARQAGDTSISKQQQICIERAGGKARKIVVGVISSWESIKRIKHSPRPPHVLVFQGSQVRTGVLKTRLTCWFLPIADFVCNKMHVYWESFLF